MSSLTLVASVATSSPPPAPSPSEPTINTRIATVKDAEAISKLVSQIFRDTYPFYADPKVSTDETPDSVTKTINTPGTYWIVVTKNQDIDKESIIGAARYTPLVDTAYQKDPNAGNDNLVRVAAENKGNKVTQKIIKFIENQFKPTKLLIRCFSYHKWVAGFYENLGFKKIGEIDYRSPEKLTPELCQKFKDKQFSLKVIRLIREYPTSDESKK